MHTEVILIADDDRVILFALAEGLRSAGYTVIEASSGEHAIEVCGDITPDLAILDMRMRGLSGLDVAKWFNENTHTPFIFLSAYDDRDTVESAAKAGALGYLVKPVDIYQILPTIRTALTRAAEIRHLKEMEKTLTQALNGNRDVSVAMGILMERHNIGQQDAFEMLRKSARDLSRKAAEIAADIIGGKTLD
ncbi:MAG: response regulator [Sulfuricellaceae bacterium]|nr:response regulator [Sulfuricellaceae bacterium]